MKTMLPALVLMVLIAPAFAQTHITDGIMASTVWGAAGSPYIIHGDIWVGGYSTLEIEPGVTVAFEPGSSLFIMFQSMIVAEGAAGNEILFTSNAATPAPGDWERVFLYYSAADLQESILSHCVFEYGIENIKITGCYPVISHCTTRHAESAGIYCEWASPQISDCDVTQNYIGIRVTGPTSIPEIHYSNICDNDQNMYVSNYELADPAVEIHAENNWWGVATFSGIGETIFIPVADQPHVAVLYDPWLPDTPVEAASWGKIKALFRR